MSDQDLRALAVKLLKHYAADGQLGSVVDGIVANTELDRGEDVGVETVTSEERKLLNLLGGYMAEANERKPLALTAQGCGDDGGDDGGDDDGDDDGDEADTGGWGGWGGWGNNTDDDGDDDDEGDESTENNEDTKDAPNVQYDVSNFLSNSPYANTPAEFVGPSPTTEALSPDYVSTYVDIDPQFQQEFAPEVLTDRSADPPSFNAVYENVDPQFQSIFGPEFLTQDFNYASTLNHAAPDFSARGAPGYAGPTGYTAEEMAAYNAQLAENASKGVYASQAQTMSQALSNLQESRAYAQAVADLKTALSNFNPEAPIQTAMPDLPAPVSVPTLSVAAYSPQQNAPAPSAPTAAAPSAPEAAKSSNVVDDVTSYLTDRISNAFNNPAALATNVAVGMVPGVGALNTISGVLGGPTIGNALFGNIANQTGPSPDQIASSTSYDLRSEVPGVSDYVGLGGGFASSSPGTATSAPSFGNSTTSSSAQGPALNTSALHDLSNYLSTQNQATPSAPSYVGLSQAPAASQTAVPSFSSVSYPSGSNSSST